MGAQHFQYVMITASPRPLVDERGNPLRNPDPAGTVVGQSAGSNSQSATFPHWLDGQLFLAWVHEARSQLTAATSNSNPVALQKAAKAIVSAYNALNIPWVIDPQARALHRRWVAGSPNAPNGNTRGSDFGPNDRYNDTIWIARDPARCIVAPVVFSSLYGGCNGDAGNGTPGSVALVTPGQYTGIIPGTARGVFNIAAPDRGAARGDPTQFLPRMQFIVRVPDDYSALPSGYLTTAPFRQVPFPFDQKLLGAEWIFNDVVWASADKQYYRNPDGSDASGNPEGWNTWSFDLNGIGTVRQQVRPSYAVYAPYLDAWIQALETRTALQIVQDARAYALWRNAMSQQAVGGQFQNLMAGMVASLDSLNRPDAQTSTVLRASSLAAAATATAVGAALSAIAGAASAGVGALIGGAITALSVVAAELVAPDFSHFNIDDLERPKPWIERSWLGGDPSTSGPSGAPPLQVDAPPGWTRPRQIIFGAITGNLMERGQRASRQAAGPAIPPVAWWIAGGLAIGSVVAYGGYKLTQGRSRTRSRSRTRRSSR